MINWKTIMCKTFLDNSERYQPPGICCEVHIRQYIPNPICKILKQSTIYHDSILLLELFSIIELECKGDPQI